MIEGKYVYGETHRLHLCLLTACSAHYSVLKTEAVFSSQISVNFYRGFPDRSRYFFIQVATQLSSRG
jgi:hypothetical protein